MAIAPRIRFPPFNRTLQYADTTSLGAPPNSFETEDSTSSLISVKFVSTLVF